MFDLFLFGGGGKGAAAGATAGGRGYPSVWPTSSVVANTQRRSTLATDEEEYAGREVEKGLDRRLLP